MCSRVKSSCRCRPGWFLGGWPAAFRGSAGDPSNRGKASYYHQKAGTLVVPGTDDLLFIYRKVTIPTFVVDRDKRNGAR